MLMTLFNIVEAPFTKVLNFDVCVIWWCSDGPINSQELKTWNLCGHYEDIYDCILPLNKQSGLQFILTQQSVGRNEEDKFGHLSIFTSLKHLQVHVMVLLRYNFQGFIFTPYQRQCMIAYIYRDMQLIFLKVKTLLNNAFKWSDVHFSWNCL